MSAVNSSVPTISVTPHSPAGINITPVSKQYSVLEENLKQLHDIVEAVQHMKDANVGALSVNCQILKLGEQCIRLSCSCPSLNELSSDAEGVGNSAMSSPSHVDLSSSMSTPYISMSSSTFHLRQRGSAEWKSCSGRIASSLNSGMSSGEISRRRSWAALEDLSTQRELDRKIGKHMGKLRSDSSSSLESDTEEIFMETESYNRFTSSLSNAANAASKDSSARSNRHASANGGTTSNISTHSLNEADLLNDFNKIRLKREEDVRLLQAKLPLQKSVSTPSILAIATRDISSSSCLSGERARAATVVDSNPANNASYMSGKLSAGVTSSARGTFAYDDRPEKRKKRGSSLFFRKKKEKTKKSNGAHVWASMQDNSSNIVLCDFCLKPVDIKNSRHCGGCQSTVHQQCVQRMSTDCSLKVKNSKLSSKTLPAQYLQTKSSNKKSSNLGVIVPSTQGSSPIINEEKEDAYFIRNHQSHGDHIINYSEEIPLVSQEFLTEEHIGANDLDTDSFLGLLDEEPDTWSPGIDKEILKKLKEKEIKKQEHIYEFVLTEKHHCLTLILMQKIFVDGLKKHFHLGPDLYRMFPRLAELTEIHLKFLYNLRKRQREAAVVESISDILLEQFSGNGAMQLKAVYGEFCSQHRDAVEIYKYLLKNAAFSAFVKRCQNNPLLKKKGIPECILFVTQRLTKYPLLIEPLIKTSKENKDELDKLTQALALVRNILTEVDSCVAEKEREDRKLEIFRNTNPEPITMYRGSEFRKSDITKNNRKLKFEGQALLVQSRGKPQPVHAIILSDVLLFLVQGNNNRFSFFTPDGKKSGVVCLQKLLVREQAGNDSRSIFLISSNPSDPEIFELQVQKPKEKAVWINSIRAAVQSCPEDDQLLEDGTFVEKQKREHMSLVYMQQVVESLRHKDVELTLIYEEKMALLLKLLAVAGVDVGVEPPLYCHLVSDYLDHDTLRKEVFNTIQKVNQLTSSLYNCSTNLSRSASSVGERQSKVYESLLLPKRAETFGGFDNAVNVKVGFVAGVGRKLSQQFQKKTSGDASPSVPSSPVSIPELSSRKDIGKHAATPTSIVQHKQQHQQQQQQQLLSCGQQQNSSQQELPLLLQLEGEQQSSIVQFTSHIFTLASIIAQQMSSIDSLEAQLIFCRRQELNQPSSEKDRRPMYKHNQQLEELRNLQDRLSHEKEQWQREKEVEQRDLEEKREQLQKLQEQVRKEQEDITLQREQLYRKLEAVSSQGLVNAANPPLLTSSHPGQLNSSALLPSLLLDLTSPSASLPISSSSSPQDWKRRPDSVRWKQSTPACGNILPLNLISATNQQKVASNVQVKQKLPLKLATKLGSTSSNGGTSSAAATVANCTTSTVSCAPTANPAFASAAVTATATSPSSVANKAQPQQLIPRKLCETNSSSVSVAGAAATAATSELRRSCSASNSSSSGYERLVSAGDSIPLTTPPAIHSKNGIKGQQIQQIIPLKLRESNSCPKSVLSVGTGELRRSCTAANSGYERLVSTETLVGSTSPSPPSPSSSSSSCPSHSRTGSSPAMMQNIRVSPPTSQMECKDGRTNTYPKAPEKYRASIGSSNEAVSKNTNNVNEEEKVIFF